MCSRKEAPLVASQQPCGSLSILTALRRASSFITKILRVSPDSRPYFASKDGRN